MDNQKIAGIFYEISEILEVQGENHFRILAYQKAARAIEDSARELSDIYNEDPKQLEEIPGIGKDLSAKIVELIKTGKCKFYDELLKHFDKNLLDLLRVRGVGPKKVKLFYSSLQINTIEKLRKAAESGKLRSLPGMGEKSEEDILQALGEYDLHQERMTLYEALHHAEKYIEYLKKCPQVKRVEYAGSLRRMKDTIGDIDILCAVKDGDGKGGKVKDGNAGQAAKKIMEYFVKYPEVDKPIAQGETKTSVILKSGIQADLRVIDENIFGAAMHYFTGSKAHNIMIRDRAKKMGMKVSEYGVFKLEPARGKNAVQEILIAGKTEEEVFKAVGLPFIVPEMREDRGEIEAGLARKLPRPIELKDLRGDLHVHSKWSDGTQEIETVARAYRDAGYEYIALTDHSPSSVVAHGLTPDRLKMQWDEIDQINQELDKEAKNGKPAFRILKGTECDIKPDGSLDFPDKILKKFDIVVASAHSRWNLTEKEQTERVLKAIKNPYVKILGHPLGRLINQREPYAINMEAIIDAAIKNKVALEINSQPLRLDLFDYYCKMAKERGSKFAINSDGHNTSQMAFLKFGIAVARRGWVEAKDVLNTMKLKELLEFLN